jgi:hypothetical protein
MFGTETKKEASSRPWSPMWDLLPIMQGRLQDMRGTALSVCVGQLVMWSPSAGHDINGGNSSGWVGCVVANMHALHSPLPLAKVTDPGHQATKHGHDSSLSSLPSTSWSGLTSLPHHFGGGHLLQQNADAASMQLDLPHVPCPRTFRCPTGGFVRRHPPHSSCSCKLVWPSRSHGCLVTA